MSKYAPVEVAREYARLKGLSYIKQWLEAAEQDDWPEHLPKYAHLTYGLKWSEILAPKTLETSKFANFDEACEIMWELNLKSMKEFRQLGREGKRPDRVHSNPEVHYKEVWKGWKYFLRGNK